MPPLPTIDWDVFEANFNDFLGHVTIVSKDEGRVRYDAYDAQRYVSDEIFKGLREDQHYFVVGKSRQLGISTLCQLFTMMYAGSVPGIQGAIVFDTHDNLGVFRTLFKESIKELPPSHRLPIRGDGDNRTGMQFLNGNMLQYLVAGVKRGQGSIGRSRALNFAHISEVSYYGDPEAYAAFKNTLSNVFPYRCYLVESTGRGYGLLYDEWEDAKDDFTKRNVFVSWWRKRTYSYATGSALWKRYGWEQLSKEEQERTDLVLKRYGHRITLEQWAWYRHNSDPRARAEGTLTGDERHEVFQQEHPTIEEELFRGTGTPFILNQFLAPAEERAARAVFKAYVYQLGDDITNTRIEPTRFANRCHLKVWEEPKQGATYVVAGDPAYGISDSADNFCAQVLRCYADRLVQVAEFCDPNVQPHQFAWIMLHLCGWYENCRYIIELNGSGDAVWQQMREVRKDLDNGVLMKPPPTAATSEDMEYYQSWRYMLGKVRQYYYHRPDSIAGSYAYQFRSTLDTKFTIMIQMADRFMLNTLDVNSLQCLREMRTLRKDGREIAAEGKKKDDRPIALALAVRAYLDGERAMLVSKSATYEQETARDELVGEGGDVGVRYMNAIMQQEWQRKSVQRTWSRRQTRRGGRWNW
jgi:hypothetical protein